MAAVRGFLRQGEESWERRVYIGRDPQCHGGTLMGMATELPLDPEFAAIVERARRRAVESGEIPARGGSSNRQFPWRLGRSSPSGCVAAATRRRSPTSLRRTLI